MNGVHMTLDKPTGKNIAVTGAAGFIGSHLVDTLLKLDNEVIGIDNFSNGRRENLSSALGKKKFQLLEGDVRDINFLLENLDGVDAIFHEAALTSVPKSVEDPLLYNDVNVNGTLNILEAARHRDVEKVVFASSCAIYGDSPDLPKKEDMVAFPKSPYAVSKLAGEAYVKCFHDSYGIDTTALRYFNVFGPRQRDSPYSGVIAIFFGFISREQDLKVFGDGKQSRDFVYVKDVVDANLRALSSPSAGGEIINVGTGFPVTINRLGKLILELTGKQDVKINHLPPRAGDIMQSYADIHKAKELLGYQPNQDVKSGLEDYLHYLDENFEEKN